MEFLERMNEALNYIESNLDGEISYERIARLSYCSMHQFGRIFSYVVGSSLSEYIRRRRLTLAALDLQTGNEKIIDISLKYGYDSPNSFSRAFAEIHGVTPTEARSKGVTLKSYPRLAFHITIKGDIEMNYRIEEKGEIKLVGILRQLPNDKVGGNESECGDVWDEFFDSKNSPNQKIRDDLKLYRPPFWQIAVYMPKQNGTCGLFIGAESDGHAVDADGLESMTISAKTWAVFKTTGHVKQLGELWLRIKTEWLPESGYVYDNSIYAEIFPMDKMWNDPNYDPEIWIPVTKK